MANSEGQQNPKFSWSELWPTFLGFIIVICALATNFLFEKAKLWSVVVCSIIVLLGIMLYTIIRLLINQKDNKYESVINEFGQIAVDMRKTANDLGKVSATVKANTDVYGYVCGSNELRELEGSVGDCVEVDNPKIYVRSTKFFLETTDSSFGNMLQDNLRKGVVYYYLIPEYDVQTLYEPFNNMVLEWWKQYSSFLKSKRECSAVSSKKSGKWDKNYVRALDKASGYYGKKQADWEGLINSVFELFKERIKVFTADECSFYTVTALYQVGRNDWKAIEKLPTDYLADGLSDYYSFVVFGERTADSENQFVTRFRKNFTTCEKYNIQTLYDSIERYNRDELYEKNKG